MQKMAKKNLSLGNFQPSLRSLRIISILVPMVFAGALGVFDDQLLEKALDDTLAHILLSVTVAVAALIFSIFMFSLLGAMYKRLDEQNAKLEQQARALQAVSEAERQRAEEWRSLFEVGRQVTASPNLPELLNSIATRARALLNADIAALMLLSAEGDSIKMAAYEGLRTTEMQTLRLQANQGLQGLVLSTGRPIIVTDYKTDPRLRERPAELIKSEGLVSLVSVPFSGKGRLLGTLTLGNRHAAQFSERQALILESFAQWAAVATETSQLYEKVESLARLEERERIGMDLHDGVIQSIYAVGLNLEDFVDRLDGASEVRAGLEKAIDDLNNVIKDIRSYIFDLRPQVSQVSDLPRALFDLVEDFRVNTLLDADIEIDGAPEETLNQAQAMAIFHVAQEALNNASKHSRASNVRVHLDLNNGYVNLHVEDNGVGFDPKAEQAHAKQGLRNMMDRARTVGADLKIESRSGRGTKVMMGVPLK